MRIVFMGTPDFAVPSLEKLLEAGAFERIVFLSGPGMPWKMEEVGPCS